MSSNSTKNEVPDQTEVYDEVDQAAMIQLAEQARAMAEVRAKTAPETHPDFDGETCIDCTDELPKERLAMGRIRCVHCQTILEKKGKLYSTRRDD